MALDFAGSFNAALTVEEALVTYCHIEKMCVDFDVLDIWMSAIFVPTAMYHFFVFFVFVRRDEGSDAEEETSVRHHAGKYCIETTPPPKKLHRGIQRTRNCDELRSQLSRMPSEDNAEDVAYPLSFLPR